MTKKKTAKPTKKSGGWNFRVMKDTYTSPAGHVEDVYRIHEVYYKTRGGDVINGFTQEGIAPIGNSLEELKQELTRMLAACEKPVLDYIKSTTQEQGIPAGAPAGMHFEIPISACKNIDTWWKRHIKKCKDGYSSGKHYSFDNSNGIGVVVWATCNGCGAHKDFTDLSTW